MKKRVLSALLTLVMLFTLIPATAVTAFAEESAELFANTCAVTFTTPSDVVLTVSEGFAVGMNEKINDGKTMKVVTPVSQSTEGDVTSHLYNLPEGTYRFLAMGEDSVGGKPADGAKVVKYYNWDKNFIVTAADVAAGSKTIDADPGLLANTGWEQKRTEYSYFVRQFTDEVLASEAATVSDATKAKYPEAFSTPSFTATNKARHEFTTQSEMEAFVAQLDEKTDYMTTYFLGRSKGDKHDLRASFFTAEDLTGKTLEQAAEAIKANGKPTILIHAQMHGDEQSGTEGALATMAYLCGEYGEEVIKTVNIVSIPRVNPDGSEIYKYESGSGSSWRNVNRDAMELTQPETKILVALYNLIEPEVCLDHHEYRASTESTESHIDDVRLSEKVSTNAPKVLADVQYELVDYLFDAYEDDGLRGYYYRSSPGTGPVTMRAYYTLRGSICMLAEIPGQRKGNQMWDRRVFSQFLTAKKMIDWTVENAALVNETVAAAKAELAATGKTFDADNQFTLQHANGTPIAAQRHIFDLRDGTLIEVRPYTLYRGDAAAHSRAYPIYYVVPKDASGIAKVLSIADMHGIEYSEVGPDEVMELRRYGGDYKVATLGEPQLYSFAGGAYKFPVAQELNAVLCTLMEPDNLDAQEGGNAYKASFSLQGHLKNNEIYRCENDSKHALTFVPAKGATCDAVGNLDHYLCTCGKAFAANEHVDALAEEDYIIPVSGHDYVEQTDGSFTCSFNCGAAQSDLLSAVASCDGIGGTVKLIGSKALTEALLVPADVTLDLGEWMLEVPAGLVVNEGGKVTNGNICVSKTSGKVVNLGSNGGWVPVCYAESEGEALYALYPAAAKTGKDVTYLDNGTKYSFGYKLENLYGDNAYVMAASANALGKIKFGVNVSLQAGGIDADYSFSKTSVDKMNEVGAGADDFFKVNLSLTGAMVDDVVATPYIKVSELGFRTEGAPSTDFVPVTEVAAFGGEKFTSLEDAVAAAEAAGGTQDIDLIADVTVKRPTTLKVNGNVRFVVKSTSDITISGPLTIDGQNMAGGKLLFQIQDEAKLTLEGVTVQNYRYTNASSNYGAVGRVEDSSTLVMKNCTVKNCEGARRGAFYITGTATVDIDGCTFEGNKALDQYGGALAIYKTAGTTVKNSVFKNNSCATFGGAIAMSSYNVPEGVVTVENCTFEGNTAGGGSFGGGIGINAGTLVVDGVTMSGNKVGDIVNDIEVSDGTFALSGNVAIERIKLAAGKTIELNGALSISELVEIDGAVGTVVLVGNRVGEYYNRFVSAVENTVITEGGVLKDPSAECVAMIGEVEYPSLDTAISAANELASTSEVEIVLVDDASLGAVVTVGGANKITIKLADTDTVGKTIAVDAGAALSIDGKVDIVGNSAAAQITLDGKKVSSSYTAGIDVLDKAALAMQYVTVQNFYLNGSNAAPVRLEGPEGASGATANLTNVTIQNNYANHGAVRASRKSTLNMTDCKVMNNEGKKDIVYYAYANGTGSIADCHFEGNVATDRGSAISIIGLVDVENCSFTNNGGGLAVVHVRNNATVATVTSCEFTNNGDAAIVNVANGKLTVTDVIVDGAPYAG